MNHHARILVCLALTLLVLVAMIACQPPEGMQTNTGADVEGPQNPAPEPLSEWMPQVLAVGGTCDAVLYVQSGPLTGRLSINATATQGDDAEPATSASVRLETALGSYVCQYVNAARISCEQAPPEPIIAPPQKSQTGAVDAEVPSSDSMEIEEPE